MPRFLAEAFTVSADIHQQRKRIEAARRLDDGSCLYASVIHNDHFEARGIYLLVQRLQTSFERPPIVVYRDDYAELHER